MRIGELVKRTNVSKQAIHHYINEGVLPRPRKLGVNAADYSDRYVDQIRTVKELQNSHFLPLSEIKKILKKQRRAPASDSSSLQLQNKYFKPLDRLLSGEIVGKMSFRQATGLSLEWLRKFEEWKIITPEVRKGKWVYSSEDVTIGKLIVEMNEIGLGSEDGLDPENLKQISDIFRDTILKAREQFMKSFSGMLPSEEPLGKSPRIDELMGIYYYLCRKFGSETN